MIALLRASIVIQWKDDEKSFLKRLHKHTEWKLGAGEIGSVAGLSGEGVYLSSATHGLLTRRPSSPTTRLGVAR